MTVQNTLFISILILVLNLLKRFPASFRYSIAMLGFIKLLLPGFIPYTIPVLEPAISSGSTFPVSGVTFSAPISAPSLSVLSIIFIIWLLIGILYILHSFLSTFLLHRKLRQSLFIENRTLKGITYKIFYSSEISVPMSLGIRPKKIFVPASWSELPADLQISLLMHEAAHIHRRDGLVQILQIIVKAIYFFHPLVWILNERLNEYREMACDDKAVSSSKTNSIAYSRYLISAIETLVPVRSDGFVNMLVRKKNRLYHRINYQIKETSMTKSSNKSKWIIWICLMIFIFPLSWYCNLESSYADTDISGSMKFSGQVIDSETGEPLPGANIIFTNTNIGAVTNKNGEFTIINIPEGQHKVMCRYIGYKHSEMVLNFTKDNNQNVTANYRLEPSFTTIETVNKTASGKTGNSSKKVKFIPYDTPPMPIGGKSALISNIIYPEKAIKNSIEGTVIIQSFIDKKGKPIDFNVLRGIPNTGLDQAAIDAIRQTKFTPAKQRDKKLGVWVTIPVNFKLN